MQYGQRPLPVPPSSSPGHAADRCVIWMSPAPVCSLPWAARAPRQAGDDVPVVAEGRGRGDRGPQVGLSARGLGPEGSRSRAVSNQQAEEGGPQGPGFSRRRRATRMPGSRGGTGDRATRESGRGCG